MTVVRSKNHRKTWVEVLTEMRRKLKELETWEKDYRK